MLRRNLFISGLAILFALGLFAPTVAADSDKPEYKHEHMGAAPVHLAASFEDLLHRQERLLHSFESLIDLYEATHDIHWLERSLSLDKNLGQFFEDRENGGFFMTSTDHENLIAREKPKHDGALPSGGAMAAGVLLRLAQ